MGLLHRQIKGHAALGATGKGDQTVGAEVLAAVLHLEQGPGAPGQTAGRQQVEEGRRFVPQIPDAVLCQLFHDGNDAAFVGGADDGICAAGLPGLFGLHLGIAAAENQPGVGVDFFAPAGGVAGFPVGQGGDRAGVHHIHIGKAVKGHDLMTVLGKQALQRLGFKLIGLTAKGIKCNFHHKSPIYILAQFCRKSNNW